MTQTDRGCRSQNKESLQATHISARIEDSAWAQATRSQYPVKLSQTYMFRRPLLSGDTKLLPTWAGTILSSLAQTASGRGKGACRYTHSQEGQPCVVQEQKYEKEQIQSQVSVNHNNESNGMTLTCLSGFACADTMEKQIQDILVLNPYCARNQGATWPCPVCPSQAEVTSSCACQQFRFVRSNCILGGLQ
jgi:hypothetical protein